ncbi:MAG: hypothetical protein H6818_20665 [Phycisphaerales bacterium]|nr:hypothetical protein [Phycisphaerales bacterium]
MKSHRILFGCCLILAGICTMPASAQPGPKNNDGPGARPGRPDVDGGLDRAGRGGRRGRGAAAQLAKLEKALSLDDAQRTEIESLLKAHEAKIKEVRDGFRPTPEEVAEMESIREDMRRAREDDDTQLMAECRDRMRAAREARNERMGPAREQIQTAEAKLHDDILAKLNDDQKKPFEDIWADVMDARGRRGNPKYDPRMLQRVVSRVKGLTPEQESTIEKLFKDFRENERAKPKVKGDKPEDGDAGKPDKAEKPARRPRRGAVDDAAGKKLYDDVMAVLTEDQKKEAESMLERANGRRGPRGGRGDRDGRDGPGRFRGGEDRPKPPSDAEDD